MVCGMVRCGILCGLVWCVVWYVVLRCVCGV